MVGSYLDIVQDGKAFSRAKNRRVSTGGSDGNSRLVRSCLTFFPYIVFIILCRPCARSSILFSSMGSSTSSSFAIRRLTNSVPLEFIVCVTHVLSVQLQEFMGFRRQKRCSRTSRETRRRRRQKQDALDIFF